MTNQEFQLQCKQLVEVRSFAATKLISKILNKEGKELEKQQAAIAILAHILPELLTHGCIIRTTTNDIAEACNCKSTMVNNVLGFAGFKYERDKVTHKDVESKGLFERYYQHEYIDDQCTKMKRTSSIFNIVATQKLFDLLKEELDLNIEVNEEELAKLHADSKAKAYKKSVKRETVIITITKDTVVLTNKEGTTSSIEYNGIDEAIEELQSLKQEETIEELSFEDEEVIELEMTDEEKAEDIINRIENGEINDSNRTEFVEEAKLLNKVKGANYFHVLIQQVKRNKRNARLSKPVTVEPEEVYDVDDNEPTTFNVGKTVGRNRSKNTVNKPVVINDEWEEQIEEIEEFDLVM